MLDQVKKFLDQDYDGTARAIANGWLGNSGVDGVAAMIAGQYGLLVDDVRAEIKRRVDEIKSRATLKEPV